MTKNTIFLTLLLFPFIVFAQSGIKGFIKTQDNKPLPYATIYIQELRTGTVANEDGYYEYKLLPGEYHLNYQFLGCKSETKTITVVNEMIAMNVKLPNQFIKLKEVNIVASSEDPAYSIMRKVVAKSKYHLMQVKSYKARVYIKGFFKINIPKIVYQMAKSEGIDTVEVHTSESLNEIEYEYPNTYRQKVLSARSNEEDSSMSGTYRYINGSFYKSTLFSSSVFGLYRFKLEGSFTDQGHEIYKIKVFPRSKGPDLFTGYVYIIKDLWAIHSLNLEVYNMGFKNIISQIYAPVKDNVWLPISHNFEFKGRVFGVKLNHKYFATVSDYQVEINTKLDKKKLILIDEKTEKEYAAALKEEKRLKGEKEVADTSKIVDEPEKFSLKDLKKTMKEMEKKEKEAAKEKKDEPELMSDYSISFDSLAYKQKISYWDSIRPVPLTDIEKKPGLGKKIDSIAAVRKADTASRFAFLGKTFGGLIFGETLRLHPSFHIHYPSPLAHANFNTVEGYNLNLPVEFIFNKKGNELFKITQTLRYGFSSKEFYYNTKARYRFYANKLRQRATIQAEGGHYISQFNADEPIFPVINSYTSLFQIDNYLKLYEKDFAAISFSYPLRANLKVKARFEWANRKELFNTSSESWVKKGERVFTPNAPENIEVANTSFPDNKASLISFEAAYKPFVKYYRSNGLLMVNDESSPTFKLNYNGGIKDLFGSSADYHRLEAGIQHHFKGVRRDFDINLFGGSNIQNNKSFFMDYKHFGGNRTILQTTSPAEAYYLLDYYRYSTAGNYWGVQSQLSFRKFLLTQNMWLNLLGVRENIVFNYLKTETSPHYIEVGYGLDNILKILKVQAVCNFENGKYQSFGIRIGLSGVFKMDED